MTDSKIQSLDPKQRFAKVQNRIRRQVGTAIADYKMIEHGDVIMACLSGGNLWYSQMV